jgi:hypothetical protein
MNIRNTGNVIGLLLRYNKATVRRRRAYAHYTDLGAVTALSEVLTSSGMSLLLLHLIWSLAGLVDQVFPCSTTINSVGTNTSVKNRYEENSKIKSKKYFKKYIYTRPIMR